MTTEDSNYDIYRDSPVRLLGYANEVGEAFRSMTSVTFVRATYAVASAYVLADTYDKANKMSLVPSSSRTQVVHAAVDTLTWQALASVMIPGFTINRVCATSLVLLQKAAPKVPLLTRKWITTAIGLGVIPFIVHPIDTGVHAAMDLTVRKFLNLKEDPTKEE